MAAMDQQTLDEELAEFRVDPYNLEAVKKLEQKKVIDDYEDRVAARRRKPKKKVIDPLEVKRNAEANVLRDAMRDRRADQKVQEKKMKEEWQQNIDLNVQTKMKDGGGFDRRLLHTIRPFQGWMRREDPSSLPHELTPEGWASPTRSLPPMRIDRAHQQRRSSAPVVADGPIAWGRRRLHSNGTDVYQQTKNVHERDDGRDDNDETMSVHTVEDEAVHGPIMYTPDDVFATPAELQQKWVPNYTQMPTPRALSSSPISSSRSPPIEFRGEMKEGHHHSSPSSSNRYQGGSGVKGGGNFLQDHHSKEGHHRYGPPSSPIRYQGGSGVKGGGDFFQDLGSPGSPTSPGSPGSGRRKKQKVRNTYMDGHGSALLDMDAMVENGPADRKRDSVLETKSDHPPGTMHLASTNNTTSKSSSPPSAMTMGGGSTRAAKAKAGISTMGSGSRCHVWIPDEGWDRDGGGHGDKMVVVIKRRLKNDKYEVIYPDKRLKILDREQLIVIPKEGGKSGGDPDGGWNEANQKLTHDHFFNRATSYKTLRTNDSLERERMIAKRRLQLKLQKGRKRAEGPTDKNDEMDYEQKEMEYRTMPGNRFVSEGLFPNTVHDPMAVFENGEGRTGRDLLDKNLRRYKDEKRKRENFADNYKPSGKDVAEEHVHGMLKNRVAAERSHELARMVIANNLKGAKKIVANGADPNLADWMDFDRTALHCEFLFFSSFFFFFFFFPFFPLFFIFFGSLQRLTSSPLFLICLFFLQMLPCLARSSL